MTGEVCLKVFFMDLKIFYGMDGSFKEVGVYYDVEVNSDNIFTMVSPNWVDGSVCSSWH